VALRPPVRLDEPRIVVHAQQHVRRAEAGPALDQRWARNVMLNKWLEYCLERGHRLV
jgi:uncharacterized protein YqiB (DUF1249 family)